MMKRLGSRVVLLAVLGLTLLSSTASASGDDCEEDFAACTSTCTHFGPPVPGCLSQCTKALKDCNDVGGYCLVGNFCPYSTLRKIPGVGAFLKQLARIRRTS